MHFWCTTNLCVVTAAGSKIDVVISSSITDDTNRTSISTLHDDQLLGMKRLFALVCFHDNFANTFT